MTDAEFIIAYEEGTLGYDATIEGFQQLIDSGIVWKLQGFYGREAQRLIDYRLCHHNRGDNYDHRSTLDN